MSMTKKDYELIASAINDGVNGNSVVVGGDMHAIVRAITDALADDNPRFDRSRFLEACGLDSETGIAA